jgi:phage replication initiation protein
MISIPNKFKSSTKALNKLEAAMSASISPAKFQNTTALHAAPPIYKMGVTESQTDDHEYDESYFDGTEKLVLKGVGKNGKVQVLRIPIKNEGVDKRAGFIDQVTFTVRLHSLQSRKLYAPYDLETYGLKHVDDAIPRISSILLDIFGFGVTHQRDYGLFHYKQSYHLGDGYGLLGIGGQNDTINVNIHGKGAMMAKTGWEERLHGYLTSVGESEAYITRIDIAADFYDGQYTPQQAKADYLEDQFSLTNRKPKAECRGDWFSEDGGKTFYVGNRESGKLLRVYEKFKQIIGSIGIRAVNEGHALYDLKKWCRVECEWHRKHRRLEPDMLINPGQYLAASYPALGFISEIQQKVLTTKKKVVATVERTIQNIKHQAGASIYALIQLKGVQVIRELIRDDIPKWAKGFDVPPPADDEQWESWEKELSMIPF